MQASFYFFFFEVMVLIIGSQLWFLSLNGVRARPLARMVVGLVQPHHLAEQQKTRGTATALKQHTESLRLADMKTLTKIY